MQVINETPFEAMPNPGFDKEGREIVTVIVKGTFKISEQGAVDALDRDKQVKIVMADEYWAAPGESPVRYESDLAMFKPGTDLILLGAAQAPDGLPARHFEVTFAVGGRSKTRSFSFWSKMDRLPLHTIDWKLEKEKWVLGKKPRDGFCFFPKSVSPRINHAGVYDENWRKSRSPFLPQDFDSHFFQAAYPDLICEPYLQGNERLHAAGVSSGPPFTAALPGMGMEIEAFIRKERVKATGNLDTLVLDAERRILILVWRSLFVVGGAPTDVTGFIVKSRSFSVKN